MRDAPTTQAEQEDAVREALIAALNQAFRGFSFPGGRWSTGFGSEMAADALLAGPIATLRARAAAAEAERDEARQRADDLFWTITEPAKAARHWQIKATAAEAQRDQLAADLRKARDLIQAYEEVNADKHRLAREIDVAMHGEEGAARQPSLCDLVGPAAALRAERDRLATHLAEAHEALAWALNKGIAKHGYPVKSPDPKDAGGTAKGDGHA